jgi:hypothetical protein
MLRFLKSVQIAQILLKNSADPDSGQGSQFPVPEFFESAKKAAGGCGEYSLYIPLYC